MDMIWTYLQGNRMVMVVVIGLVAWGFYRLTAKPMSELKDRGLVPAHVRFNRREVERKDRRQQDVLPLQQVDRRRATRRNAA